MTKITIDMKKPIPAFLNNWANEYDIGTTSWEAVQEIFHKTTNGQMIGIIGSFTYDLVFENDSDAICFILRYT
jgi:hypothetical protein